MIDFSTLGGLSRESVDGHQLKGTDGIWWYKMDSHGYESISEDVCSKMNALLGVKEFVNYDVCSATYNGVPVRACRSKNFVPLNHKLLSIDELAYMRGHINLLDNFQVTTPRVTLDRFLRIADTLVGAKWIRDYIVDMLWLDILYFNIDRHTGNISVFATRNDIKPVPYYDFGESLFADARIFANITEDNAPTCVHLCQVNPFHMSVKEMAYALGYIKKFPWDLKRLEKLYLSDIDVEIRERIIRCLEATTEVIQTYGL